MTTTDMKSLITTFLRLRKSSEKIIKLNYKRNVSSNTPNLSEEEKQKELERIAKDASLEEPPTSCCQSGCSNCVFIVWAEALTAKMENAGPEIVEKIMNSVQDPSMKAYIEMELRMRGLKK